MTSRVLRIVALALAAVMVAAGRAEAACQVQATGPATFSPVTSFAVRTTVQTASTTNAGLVCSGAVLSVLQTGDHVYVRITSANGGLLGPEGDVIGYSLYADSTTTYPIAFGVQFDYASGSLLNLLGLFGGPATSLPLFLRTTTGANVDAGPYTDTLTLEWAWDYCSGIGLFGICLGRDIGAGTAQVSVSMLVNGACQVSTTPDVSFGPAPTVAHFLPVHQAVSVLCTKGITTHTIGINGGLQPVDGQRSMAGQTTAGRLRYDLFKAGTNDLIGPMGTARIAAPGEADGTSAQSFAYRAVVYPNQAWPPVDHYTDTLVVDVTF